jgi:malonyl-CoA O-methyltransferase
VVDWWSFNGASQALLRKSYARARLLRVEADTSLLRRGRAPGSAPWWSSRRRAAAAGACAAPHEVQPGSADLLWSNMMLHWVADPQAEMQSWQRILAVDGFVMFSTLGPGSLLGLRDLYERRGWPPPFAPFVDMHDLGDMLLRCGFADPVMDQEILTLTWPDGPALLREVRAMGGNADPRRAAGLRTPHWRDALLHELQQTKAADGRLRLDFEIVYGHAFKAVPKARAGSRTTVALDDMRSLIRAARRGGPPVGLR